MATASDTFTRADAGSLGANWTVHKGLTTGLGILSNQVCGSEAGYRNGSYYSATAFGADQFSEVALVNLTASLIYGAVVRSITTGSAVNFYAGGENANFGSFYRIWKFVAGTETSLAVHASEGPVAGEVLRLEVSGTTLTLFANGVQKVQVTDASLAAGQPGMYAVSMSLVIAYFDTWSGGDLSAPATFIPSTRARILAPILAQ